MNRRRLLMMFALGAALTIPAVAWPAETADGDIQSLWVGGHCTTLSDYGLKVGEYNLGREELLPEFRYDLHSRRDHTLLDLQTHYYDRRNIFGRFEAQAADRLTGMIQYRSLGKRFGQDMLSNLETREWQSTRPGGKILTHEVTDSAADYHSHRHEIASQVGVLLSRTNNLRLMAAHRTILENGSAQQVNTSHCYSCHVVSQTRHVDNRTHQLEAGVQADIQALTAGYTFNYRSFSSSAASPWFAYDSAAHPASGASGPEFASRVTFSDTTLPVGVLPKTRTLAHKARLKGQVAGGQLSGALTYSTTKNQDTNVSSDAYGGTVQYAHRLSTRTRLVTRAGVMRRETDDYFVDLATFREGRPGPQVDFDFLRRSSLNRLDARGSAELSTRLNPKATLSLLAAYNRVHRDDYPFPDSVYTTNKYLGQAKLRYRPTTRMDASVSYRFEKTSHPFTSGRGLFEAPGRDILQPLAPNFAFIFYFQREDLRYQTITTLPTDRHEASFGGSLALGSGAGLQWNIKGVYDKNGDLDSLDVEHLSFQPTIGLTMATGGKWSYAAGYSYTYDKSRLPVTMPLFDG
ncbi:MAG: hypothetical protein GYA46_05155 [candidate division Zixibacteria bacterium]|nr:hypothetical protein [candidate division Zixibacteria bacterium]